MVWGNWKVLLKKNMDMIVNWCITSKKSFLSRLGKSTYQSLSEALVTKINLSRFGL